MKLKKILPAGLAAAVVCAGLVVLPGAIDAATVTSIDAPKAGATEIRVTYKDAQPTDQYYIAVNGYPITGQSQLGEIGVDGEITTKSFYLPSNVTLNAGDKVQFYLEDNGTMVPTEVTVVENLSPNLPTSWSVSSSSVTMSENASVEVSFDSGYVPHQNDQIQVTRYDANGAAVDIYNVALPDTYTEPVAIQLRNSTAASYYMLRFVPGAGTSDLSDLRVNVTQGSVDPGEDDDNEPTPDDEELLKNATSMTFSYPSVNVSLGESVTPTIQLTDKDGNTHDYNGPVIFSYSGDAITAGSFDTKGRFSVSSNQAYVGTKIQVTAMVGSFSKTVELTVQASNKSLILTPDSGSVGNSRALTFQLADGQGNRLKLLWQPTIAEVVIKSTEENSTAKMAGTVTNLGSLTTNGSGTLLVSSDTVTDAQIYIIFRDSSGRLYETGIADFSFTEATGDEEMNVHLNIGSTIYTVNGVDQVADTAAIVTDGRTYVPHRLLVEALGGSVLYDGETQTVTSVYGDTIVTMKIGSDEYSINGDTYKMDATPFINSDNRAMVPLRFVGEAFGCSLTPIYGEGTGVIAVDVVRE